MGLSSKTRSVPFRSISLPCRSHPSTDRIMKSLNKTKIWESTLSLSNPSAENICSGFSQLTQLYDCFDDLVKTNIFQNLSKCNSQTMKSTDELLDTSVKFLDICTNTTEIISLTLQQIRNLGCDLRRNSGASGIKNIIANYIVIRNIVKREVKGSMASLKQAERIICSSPLMVENDSLISVFQAFREVTTLSIVIFRLLLVYLEMPSSKVKSSKVHRWASFISNSKVVPEEIAHANANELQQLDATLFKYGTSDSQEFIQVVPKKLEALEATLESFDSHIHLLSRRLIGTRASLLNTVSFY